MSYKFLPYVISTTPSNMSVDVATSTDISIVFSTDMDVASLQENIVVQEAATKKRVAGTISYKDRVATFRPAEPFEPGTMYIVTIVGDGDLNDGKQDGVKSILGYPMPGVFTVIFTTAASKTLPAPEVVFPAANTTINPEDIRFEWLPVDGAVKYDVELSAVPEMDPLIWRASVAGTTAVPAEKPGEGNYFWRVRAVGQDGTRGMWSAVVSFYAGTTVKAADEQEEGLPGSPDITLSFMQPAMLVPEMDYDVDPALEEILVRLPFAVNPSDIKVRLVGKSMSGDPFEDHGIVLVNVDATADGNTTLVRITEKADEESEEV